jgi:PTH1 family peptidyl-tRNA hydrolase
LTHLSIMAFLRLIAGLGNPGPEHSRQRHNAGFWFADALARQSAIAFQHEPRFSGALARVPIGRDEVIVLKPATFMNRSAASVLAVLRFWKIEPEQMLVVHDDLDLAPGTARLKLDGGHGGQNGLRDLIAQLGHGRFHRLRIGIGHPGQKDKVTSWVLGRPSTEDEVSILRSVDAALAVLPLLANGDVGEAMKRLHTRTDPAF